MSQYRPLSAVVLAAGEGTRMRSGMPKVLHPLCGRPMVLHVIDALAELPLERIVVVVGHGAERVTKTLQDQLVTEVPVEFVEQRVQRGTGDAVSVAITRFDDLDAEDDLLVLPADAPLVRAETIARLATEHRVQDAAAADPYCDRARAVRPRKSRARQGQPRRSRRRARRRDGRGTRHRRDQHVDLLLPARPARAGAAPPEPRERARRVLPHRRDRGVARRGPQGDRAPGRRSRRGDHGERPGAARRSRGRAARRVSTGVGCARVSRWSTPTRPTSTRASSSSPTCGCCRAPFSKAVR